MAQKQKAEYEYVESRGLYRKRVQDEQSRITLDIYAHLTYNRPEDILPKILMAFGSDEKGGLSNGREKEAQV